MTGNYYRGITCICISLQCTKWVANEFDDPRQWPRGDLKILKKNMI